MYMSTDLATTNGIHLTKLLGQLDNSVYPSIIHSTSEDFFQPKESLN